MSAAILPPDATAAAGAPTASVDDGYALVAATPAGPVRLSWGPAVGNAAQAAVALHALGDWLEQLEDWLAPEQGLDWWPIDDAVYALRQVEVDWISAAVDADADTVIVSLPWPSLRERPEPPDALRLQWPALPAELLLARQPLPPEAPDQIEPGAVLLLEPSFEPAWIVSLRRSGADDDSDPGRPLVCDGRLAWPTPVMPPRREATRPRLEVRMPLPTPVPVPLLTGWHARDTAFPADAPATLHLITVDGHDAFIAEGQLLPWGRGHALRMTDVAVDARSDKLSWT